MNRLSTAKLILATVLLLFFTLAEVHGQIAVRGDTVYTMDGFPVPDGIVLVNNGKIERVGPSNSIEIPDDYEVYEATAVTPGLIDAHTVVGLAGIYNQDSDQDQLETSHAIQPELRAIDAYNAREDLVKFVMNKGVTTIHTGHGPGALASGQTMIAKTAYNTVEESVMDSVKAIAFTLGSGVSRNFNTPGTRAKGVAMLRQQFIEAQAYAEKRKEQDEYAKKLNMEILADVLEGKITALVTAQRAHDIMTALRLQEEFGFEMILDGAAEAYLVLDEIKKSGVPVIVHPTMVRTYGDTRNASFTTPAKLHEAGIPFAFQSGYEGYVPKTRIVPFEAAIAVANNLDRNAALKALTIDAAQMLGIDNRVGSLSEGKDADLVLYDGDPFEYTTHITTVIVDGKVVKKSK